MRRFSRPRIASALTIGPCVVRDFSAVNFSLPRSSRLVRPDPNLANAISARPAEHPQAAQLPNIAAPCHEVLRPFPSPRSHHRPHRPWFAGHALQPSGHARGTRRTQPAVGPCDVPQGSRERRWADSCEHHRPSPCPCTGRWWAASRPSAPLASCSKGQGDRQSWGILVLPAGASVPPGQLARWPDPPRWHAPSALHRTSTCTCTRGHGLQRSTASSPWPAPARCPAHPQRQGELGLARGPSSIKGCPHPHPPPALSPVSSATAERSITTAACSFCSAFACNRRGRRCGACSPRCTRDPSGSGSSSHSSRSGPRRA